MAMAMRSTVPNVSFTSRLKPHVRLWGSGSGGFSFKNVKPTTRTGFVPKLFLLRLCQFLLGLQQEIPWSECTFRRAEHIWMRLLGEIMWCNHVSRACRIVSFPLVKISPTDERHLFDLAVKLKLTHHTVQITRMMMSNNWVLLSLNQRFVSCN